MVYIDPTELSWRPYVVRWLKALPKLGQSLKDTLLTMFDNHLPNILHSVHKNMTQAIPQTDGAKIATLCDILQELMVGVDSKLDWQHGDQDHIVAAMLNLFAFSLSWSVGGNLIDADQDKFDTLIRDSINEIHEIKIPGAGTVFDYYYNTSAAVPCFESWDTIVPVFSYDPEVPFFDMLVPTTGTVKYSYLLEKLLVADRSVLFTGTTGVGKSVVARDCLRVMSEKRGFVPVSINFSAQTSSLRTQEMIESKLEKKRKNILGAPENKRIIIFVDDLNMPRLDTYGAQPPIELLRQYQDFRGFYDREKLFWKEIKDVTLAAACAPPGGGRNNVTPRFIRHFAMFCLPAPDERSLRAIFSQIMDGFTSKLEFQKSVQRVGPSVVSAAVEIYQRMSAELLPTPAKSHYVFNLRDLSKCMQGVLQADNTSIREGDQLWELFCHESMRVFHDRLVTPEDKLYYCGVLAEMSSKHFGKVRFDH
jgi:dynein heavy chain